eukprot:scaffold61299_cov59-Phaeocystis_antarctica.AAC.6
MHISLAGRLLRLGRHCVLRVLRQRIFRVRGHELVVPASTATGGSRLKDTASSRAFLLTAKLALRRGFGRPRLRPCVSLSACSLSVCGFTLPLLEKFWSTRGRSDPELKRGQPYPRSFPRKA